jgi:hypothetical protein
VGNTLAWTRALTPTRRARSYIPRLLTAYKAANGSREPLKYGWHARDAAEDAGIYNIDLDNKLNRAYRRETGVEGGIN